MVPAAVGRAAVVIDYLKFQLLKNKPLIYFFLFSRKIQNLGENFSSNQANVHKVPSPSCIGGEGEDDEACMRCIWHSVCIEQINVKV